MTSYVIRLIKIKLEPYYFFSISQTKNFVSNYFSISIQF